MKARIIIRLFSCCIGLSTLTSFASLISPSQPKTGKLVENSEKLTSKYLEDNKQLLKAAQDGNSKEVERLLIEAGTYKDQVDIYGTRSDTPLSYALDGVLGQEKQDEFSKIIRMLLLAGDGELAYASRSKELLQRWGFYQDTLKYILTTSKKLLKEKSVIVCSFVLDNNELPSVLVTIIREYYEDLDIRLFVCTHIESLNKSLLKAARNGNHGEVERLLQAGADKNATEKSSLKPLHWAAIQGHGAIVEMLLRAGADKVAVDVDGWTPLHNAAQNGHEAVVELILKIGADKNAVTKDGRTPLHLAAHQGHGLIVELLLKAGADTAAVTKDGWTALHLAAQERHGAVVELLLKTQQRGHKAVVGILIKAGATE